MGQTDKATAPLLTVGLGVLCLLFMNGDFVSGTAPPKKVPRRQKTRAFLQSTIDFHHSKRKTFMEETKKIRGFSNNLRKLQKTLFTMLRQSCIEEIFFCVCKFVITGLFLPIFI